MGVKYQMAGKEIYLDANIFIYLLEGYEELTPLLTQLFKLIDAGSLRAVTSELTLAETLVKPMSDKNLSLQQAYKNALQTSSGLEVRPITRDILISAAQLRADLSVRLPDAIHIATARAAGCKTFLTNDKPLKKDIGMPVMIISEVKSADLVI